MSPYLLFKNCGRCFYSFLFLCSFKFYFVFYKLFYSIQCRFPLVRTCPVHTPIILVSVHESDGMRNKLHTLQLLYNCQKDHCPQDRYWYYLNQVLSTYHPKLGGFAQVLSLIVDFSCCSLLCLIPCSCTVLYFLLWVDKYFWYLSLWMFFDVLEKKLSRYSIKKLRFWFIIIVLVLFSYGSQRFMFDRLSSCRFL